MKAIYVCLMVIWGTFIDISAQSLSVEDSLKFCQEEISDAVFCRMMGKSYKEECTTPREELRYLRVLHYNKVGEELQGELVCHKDIADDLLAGRSVCDGHRLP